MPQPKQPVQVIDAVVRALRNRNCPEWHVSIAQQVLADELRHMHIVPAATNAEVRRFLNIDISKD